INIHNDHGDSMGARDSGWIQLYGENNQEAYDNHIMAVCIGEHPDVLLPVMNCYDGFITSHSVENIELLEDEKVRQFVGDYNPPHCLINPKQPIAVGGLDLASYYFEHKRSQVEGMRRAKDVILEVAEEYEALTGRRYGLFEAYRMEDAERAIVLLGSSAGTAKHVVDCLRSKGEKVGLIKLRVFRPFPAEELAAALSGCQAVAIMDKSDGFNGKGAPVFNEVCSALYYEARQPLMVNYIYGIGGRDVRTESIEVVYSALTTIIEAGKVTDPYRYLGVVTREEQ
ncbi:MAG: pyruvate ferredoxin oxidoreductase, partial [Cellulosilyticaceae bacterium]